METHVCEGSRNASTGCTDQGAFEDGEGLEESLGLGFRSGSGSGFKGSGGKGEVGFGEEGFVIWGLGDESSGEVGEERSEV